MSSKKETKFAVIETKTPHYKMSGYYDDDNFKHYPEGRINYLTKEQLIDRFFSVKFDEIHSEGFVLSKDKWISATLLASQLQYKKKIPKNSLIKVGHSYVCCRDNKLYLGKDSNTMNFIDSGDNMSFIIYSQIFDRTGFIETENIILGCHTFYDKDFDKDKAKKVFALDKDNRYGTDVSREIQNFKLYLSDDGSLYTMKQTSTNRNIENKHFIMWNKILYNLELIEEGKEEDIHILCKLIIP